MPSSPPNNIATRESRKISPLPEFRADVGFAESYTSGEFELIKRGLIPEAMEDKWFIFYEDPWLYFHSSWTGDCLYGVRFQSSGSGALAVESWTGSGATHHSKTRTDSHRLLLRFVIGAFLLRRQGVATRESWKILPLPEIRADVGFAESYTAEDFESIKRGLIPRDLDDAWFVFYEDPWLYLHSSWTGACIYGVRFQSSGSGAFAVESWVSREAEHNGEPRIGYDLVLLKNVVDVLARWRDERSLKKGEFRCFGCRRVIREEDDRCGSCGWTWK